MGMHCTGIHDIGQSICIKLGFRNILVQEHVRESCVVALDMYHYEQSGDFQYANTASTVNGGTWK